MLFIILVYYQKPDWTAPEAFRRYSQEAPPVSRAPPGHTVAPQARMDVCACVCRLSGGEGTGHPTCPALMAFHSSGN